MKLQKRSGQALTEFAILICMMFFVVIATVFFMSIFGEWQWRIFKLIGMDL
ncbi:MAG: hypothetical protein HRT89_20225 [Lentisphaeria bacterium]|nr:hypothetical protein [Lentisphaeria bacterium]NQZ70387.1 hypothetical protein [Lentisphaeria bacterium]